MKNKFIFLIFLSLSISANAQVAGYMGKRFVIGYSNYFMAGLRGPGPNYSGSKDDFSPTVNHVNCLNFEYTKKERVNICLSVQYLRTGIAYDDGHEIGLWNVGYVDPYSYPGRTRYKGNFSVPAHLTSLNFGLGYKLFANGCVAPVGGYQKVEILLLFETVKFDNKHFYIENPNNYYYPDILTNVGTDKYHYRTIVLTYNLGKQKVLFDKLVLDYGIRFGITPAGIIPFVFADYGDVQSSMDKYFRSESNRRIFREQLLNIHLGIGFLAF